MRRKLFFMMGMMAATAGPYLYSNGDFESIKKQVDQWLDVNTTDGFTSPNQPVTVNTPTIIGDVHSYAADDRTGAIVTPANPSFVPHATIATPPRLAFHQYFDFNITPDVVVAHWPRVSTSLAELNMSGMRVALVTGTQPDDLHGSLTYYFDQHRRLQRIAFQGRTGDARKLIALLTEYHEFRASASLGAGFYSKRWNGRYTSALWIEHAPLIDENSSHSSQSVTLEINRTDGPYRLSEQFATFLEQRVKR